jgi:hypothetical protein
MILVSCKSLRNTPKSLVTCQIANDCPVGYTCEQVPNTEANLSVCCKDKGCAIGATPGAGVDASNDSPRDLVIAADVQIIAIEASTAADSYPVDSCIDLCWGDNADGDFDVGDSSVQPLSSAYFAGFESDFPIVQVAPGGSPSLRCAEQLAGALLGH